MKKSQLSILVIIGLIIIVIVGTLILLRSEQRKTDFDIEKIRTGEAEIDQKFLDAYVEHCTEITTIEAEKRYGLDKKSSIRPISSYISSYLPVCLENFDIFREQNFEVDYESPDVTVTITNNALIADVIFPIRLTKGRTTLKFDETKYTFPRTVTEEINPDTTTTLRSSDKTFVVEIPPGTKAYVGDEEVKEVGLKQLDRNFNGLSNGVIAGMMAINGIPHGVQFSQPVKVTKYYEDYEIPPFIKEENLKVGYYHNKAGFWVGLPTEVDPVNNKLTVYTTHFSVYGTVVNCGGGDDPVSQIVTPTLVSQVCNDCEGWTYDSSENPKYGQLYKIGSEITPDKDYTRARLIEDSELPDNPSGTPERGDGKIWKDIDYEDDKYTCFSSTYTLENIKNLYPPGKKLDDREVVSCQKPLDSSGEITETSPIPFDDERTELDEDSCFDVTFDEYVELDDTDYKSIFDGEKITADNYKLVSADCEEENCMGDCISIGNFKAPSIECKDVESENVYPVEGEAQICLGEFYSYPLVEDLKGRAIYVIEFDGNGDSCFAQVETETTAETEASVPDADVPHEEADEEVVETQENTCEVEVKESDGVELEDLKVVLRPLCLENDLCQISKYRLYQDPSSTDKVLLWFIVETVNQGGEEDTPDACIQSNVVIEFEGFGAPKGSYNLLCNDKTENKIDYVQGECKQCVKNSFTDNDGDGLDDTSGKPQFEWVTPTSEKYGGQQCMFINDKYCPASLIGKLYNKPGESNTVTCMKCVASEGQPFYGEWIESDGCDSCFNPTTGPNNAEEEVPEE